VKWTALKITKKSSKTGERADPEAVWRLLGMAVRAGKAVSGAEATLNALRRKKACLILLAEDSSENTRRKFIPPDRPPAIPVIMIGSKAVMGHWTGHEERTVTAVCDQGFADRLRQLIEIGQHQTEADHTQID
jgi:ribosomal protein L7Ae-like RNA K-turn-binding protein